MARAKRENSEKGKGGGGVRHNCVVVIINAKIRWFI